MKMVKGLLLQHGKEPQVVDFDKDDYKELYRLIQCRCFGHGIRKVDGEYYDFWFDDEFLLNPDYEYKLTGFCKNASEVILGNLLVTKHEESEIATLNKGDIIRLLENVQICALDLENVESVLTSVLIYEV